MTIEKMLMLILGFLLGLSVTAHAQEGSASGTATYEAPENVEARLAALSNTEKLVQRCGVVDIAEITEEQLVCMEENNPILIAHLALLADRAEILSRVRAIGRMKLKHKTFSGLGREMRACGFSGNLAIIAWKWYKAGDKSQLACLEAQHAIVLQAKADENTAEDTRQGFLDVMKLVDCKDANTVLLKKMCRSIKALIRK